MQFDYDAVYVVILRLRGPNVNPEVLRMRCVEGKVGVEVRLVPSKDGGFFTGASHQYLLDSGAKF